jgi:hypothetical protein
VKKYSQHIKHEDEWAKNPPIFNLVRSFDVPAKMLRILNKVQPNAAFRDYLRDILLSLVLPQVAFAIEPFICYL